MSDSFSLAIMRDLPSERRVSMERYADEVFRAFEFNPEFEAVSYAPQEKRTTSVTNSLAKLARYDRRYRQYPAYARTIKADIYHIVDHSYAHLMRTLPAERTVVTCHDLMLLTLQEWRGYGTLRPVLPLFKYSVNYLAKAALVVAVSEATKRDLLRFELANPENLEVVRPSISDIFLSGPSEPIEDQRRQMGGTKDELLILHVGTPGPYKNLETVIECVVELRRRGVPVKLVRVGRPFSDQLRRLGESAGVMDRIIELGRLDDCDLARVYASSDVLLFPSLKEGYGWPVLEAMACKLPVVTSRDPALCEISDGVGLQADAKNVPELADAVSRLWTDSALREQCRHLGRQRAIQHSRTKMAESLAMIYKRVAAQAAGWAN